MVVNNARLMPKEGMRRTLALFLVSSCTACSSLLFYPSRVRFVDPKSLSYTPQEVRFKERDGNEIVAWYFQQPQGLPVKARVVFFHGNGQNLSTHYVSLYWLLQHGYEFLIYDYPGYGASQGDPSPENAVTSGLAAAQWLAAREPKRPLAFFGQSLGGAVAYAAALENKAEIPLCLMVVESTFNSFRGVARDVLAKNWWSWWLQPLTYLVLSDRYAPNGREKDLSPTPLIVIHGDDDGVIDIKRGEKLFGQAAEPKEFWRIPGGQHIDTFTGPLKGEFRPRLVAALDRHCQTTDKK